VIADALAWKLCKPIRGSRKIEEKKEVPVGSLAWRLQMQRTVKSGWD
jgi:hypothetical protein